jgi:hypothetical protein
MPPASMENRLGRKNRFREMTGRSSADRPEARLSKAR